MMSFLQLSFLQGPIMLTDFQPATCSDIRVRYNEADMQGIVFNANYLIYADIGVTEYYRALGAAAGLGDHDKWLQSHGGETMVRHAEVEFLRSAKADDILTIAARCLRIGRTSFTLLIRIMRGTEHLADVRLTNVWFDGQTPKPLPLPDKLIAQMEAFEAVSPQR